MTVLRFGTDTGHVTPRVRTNFTSVGGRHSQGVTTLQHVEVVRACVCGLWTAATGSLVNVGGL
jgi:hypothetical protein